MKAILWTTFILLFFAWTAQATEFTSTSFKVLDPVIDIGSGPRAVSGGFADLTALGQPAIGRSTSNTWTVLSGFLYFSGPTAAPTPTPTPIPPSVEGGGPLNPPITYFPPFYIPPEIITVFPPEFPPPIVIKPPVIPPGCIPGQNGISPADLNCDGRVNLIDFSILLYFLPRPIENSRPADINRDNTVNLADLSIMFSEWTERLVSFVNGNGNGTPAAGEETKKVGYGKMIDQFARGKEIFDRLLENSRITFEGFYKKTAASVLARPFVTVGSISSRWLAAGTLILLSFTVMFLKKSYKRLKKTVERN